MLRKYERRDNETVFVSLLQSVNDTYLTSANNTSKSTVSLNSGMMVNLIRLFAAASILLLGTYFIIFRNSPSTKDLARAYYHSNLEKLSQTMGTSDDSLQLGISAYNNKNYHLALSYFNGIVQRNALQVDALKNLGLTYLALKKYDDALLTFEKLSQMNGMYSNPGVFLKAITLFQRGRSVDLEAAPALLRKVVDQKLGGYKEAEKWLNQ